MFRKQYTSQLRVVVLLSALFLGAAACDSSKATGGESRAEVALSKLPSDQRRIAEHMLQGKRHSAPQPLIYIDGKRYDPRADDGPYQVINPELIKSVEVLKGDAAEERAGSSARDGLVLITTKAQDAQN